MFQNLSIDSRQTMSLHSYRIIFLLKKFFAEYDSNFIITIDINSPDSKPVNPKKSKKPTKLKKRRNWL